ncbi:putative acyl-activating enzyme 6 [Camellia lanceoleosa]|uniref:Acyl-activating enzyme 6 n=1 Tax=Camellia lanceoleosa TaxID=1840588 RepID=A0ACC0HKQ2_9ERIC|nr:putative acyl-activating enzyme 6 [Camellia lanceoleosa]
MDLLKPSPANSCPLTPLTFLERAATIYGDCPSIVYNTTTYTWSQTNRRCIRLASSIASLGIGRGHVVSVVAPNIPAMYELQFAVPMTGAILNTVNTRLDARMISVLLNHSESKLVFVDSQMKSLVIQAITLLPSEAQHPLLVLITDDEVSFNLSSSTAVDIGYEDLVNRGDPEFKWVRPESEWDPMVLNYTSGTTSSPKGVDRSKDVIISGGENVCSVEVESILYSHPAVNDAAVVAKPDEFWGETGCAFVSLKDRIDEKVRENDVIEFCRARLPHYMVPKTVVFMEELPRSSTGKIHKFSLRDIAKSMGSLPPGGM